VLKAAHPYSYGSSRLIAGESRVALLGSQASGGGRRNPPAFARTLPAKYALPPDSHLFAGYTAMPDFELYDLRVTVVAIEGRSVCGLSVGDYFELTESAKLKI